MAGSRSKQTATGPGLFKLVGGNLTTIVTTVELGANVSNLNAGLSLNVRTGNYIVASGIYVIRREGRVAARTRAWSGLTRR